MPLSLGNFKIDERLDDDSLYQMPPDAKVLVNGEVVPVGQIVAQEATEAPAEDTTTGATTAPGETSETGIGVGGEVPQGPADQNTYQWWSTAELMSYNMEFALESRWQSIGSRAIMDGLSIAKSVGDIWAATQALLGMDTSSENPAGGTSGTGGPGGTGGTPDGILPPSTLMPDANRDQKEQAIVDYATQFQGLPYELGAQGPNAYDCSGFAQMVFKKVLGINLPRQADQQSLVGTKVSREELQPGDLVFYYGNPDRMNNIGHVMIYIGNGKVMGFGSPGGIYNIDYRTGGRGYAWSTRVF